MASSGGSFNQGYIYIDNVKHGLPSDVSLEEGYHIVYYVPEYEYLFSGWECLGSVKVKSGGEADNPSQIKVSGPGEVRVVYKIGPQLEVSCPYGERTTFIEAPVKLLVRVTSKGKPVSHAEVKFYVNAQYIGFNISNRDGYSSYSYAPARERAYKWNVTAEKNHYESASSEEWEFAFQKIRFDPSDGEVLTDLPIYLTAIVRMDGAPVGDAYVSFFVDNEYKGYRFSQGNGYAQYKLKNASVGVHSWYFSVNIAKWGIITSQNHSFTYVPQIGAELLHPKHGEGVINFTSTVKLEALILSLDKPVQGVNVSFVVDENMLGYNTSDADGVASFSFSPPVEDEMYEWYVAASGERLIDEESTWSFYYPVQSPYIEVDRIFTGTGRADVGSEQPIGFHMRWENGSDVGGATIRTKGGLEGASDDSGWVTFTVTSMEVGLETWKIVDASFWGTREFRHNGLHPKVIWDMVQIELSLNDSRVDMGTSVAPEVDAFYAYDGSKFEGSIQYNTELQSNEVCEKVIKVDEVQDNMHGLSVFESNEIRVVWDRVLVSLEIPHWRVEMGSEPEVTINGIYEFDEKPFRGSIRLDHGSGAYDVGERVITVSSVSDDEYNLSVFESNEVSYIIDEINFEQDINTVTPMQIQISTTLRYKSDNEPVEDAIVRVNGLGDHVGSGEYSSTVYTLNPFQRLDTEIKLNGFEEKVIRTKTFSISNIVFESILMAIVPIGLVIIRLKRK